MKFTTPWCYPRFRDSSFFADVCNESDVYFCISGLREWNIPKGCEVRLHISTKPVRGAQKSIYGAKYMMPSLTGLADANGLAHLTGVWWWPEIRWPQKGRGSK